MGLTFNEVRIKYSRTELNGVQEAGGSNPLTQTNRNPEIIAISGFLF